MFLPFSGIEAVISAGGDASTAATAGTADAHSSVLADATAWDKYYNWYPDTPGEWPASKWDWYTQPGGLYDQAHGAVPADTGDAPADAGAAAAAPTATLKEVPADFAWQRGYSWYPDTPGAYPESKMDWYYSSGGLYDQSHKTALAAPVAAADAGHAAAEGKPVRASPGHLLMCGHACLAGFAAATDRLLKTGDASTWSEDFAAASKAAAGAVSPVSAFILSEHVLPAAPSAAAAPPTAAPAPIEA